VSTILLAFKANNDEHLSEQVGIMKYLAKEVPTWKDSIEIQVFRTSKGIVYRILEIGYGLKNRMWKTPEFFSQISYDNRSMDYDEEMEKFAEEIDHLVKTKQYYIIDIKEKQVR
jgi:hypothetical protein